MSKPAASIMVHSKKPIECCDASGFPLSPRYVHPLCYPIIMEDEDNAYATPDCMSYVRSVVALRSDCSFGPSDQVNQVTHYLDGSQIYGSTMNRTRSLRAFSGGKLRISTSKGKSYLPISEHPTQDCQVSSPASACFRSGDSRVNFQPALTAMHTLWYREHNRIADELAALNDQWDDDRLFHEARRIVIAEMQHITYSDWLVKVLSGMYVRKLELSSEYEESGNPAVSNSFATAAMRALKSLYVGRIELVKEDRAKNASFELEKYFNNPELMRQPDSLDGIVRGLASQRSQRIDVHYPEALINQLYTTGDNGFDVLSLDIQRGRDHGLPGYVHYRSLCGMPEVRDYDDLVDVMPQRNIDALEKVYTSPLDIDLIVGGLMETPEGDSLFGPTFSCIVADQFRRTKKGDRYFYTNKRQPRPFANSQLNEIKKVTLARIFCDNTDGVERIQRDVFERVGEGNEMVACNGTEIPRMNLAPWRESREKYSH
ncbi:hypothetical protein NQ318_007071 [Aromia moschata]|uniref:Peroxidase n=1 Tax=Aromia moschata TaxID=1265417 RepID=A0AAV8XA21_9CUCU|nr:hypothetical protein NQ318_007071 [Aromia moschata]